MEYHIQSFCAGSPACRSLSEFLGITDGRREIVSFVGGGGKTTMLFRLAHELSGLKRDGSKRKVLLSTTTRMRLPDNGCVLLSPSLQQIENALLQEPFVIIGTACPPKMEGVEEGVLVPAQALADVVLLEADGAKGKPLKAPAPHEPVIRPETTKVAAVVGMSCLMEPAELACHRPELVLACLGAGPGHVITVEDITALAVSGRGLKKAVGDRDFYILLNQAEGRERQEQAKRIAADTGYPTAAVWREGEQRDEGMD